MNEVGVIGLGVMGRPMAANLLRAGFGVSVHSRSRGPVDALVAQGARAAGHVRDLGGLDVVLTVLPDSPDVEAVALGDQGLLAHARPGLLLIDMGTTSPETTRRLADEAGRRGVRFLDAPVSGGEAGAVDASLSIMAGGDQDVFDAAAPVLDALGSTVVRVGPTGAGQLVKAANQLLVAGTIALVSEAVLFLEAHDVRMGDALRVLRGGLAGNRILERRGEAMLDRSFAPGFRAALQHKDLGIALDAARRAGVALPLGGLTAQLYTALVSGGGGELDHTALLTLLESLSPPDRSA